MVTFFEIYKITSDLDDLPDDVMPLCDDCANKPSGRHLVALETTNEPCYGCAL